MTVESPDEEGFEPRLVAALQPVRQHFLAQVVEFGLRSGLLDALNSSPRTKEELAATLGMDPGRLTGLLRYLANEAVVADPDGKPSLTALGQEFLAFRPWYALLIGGYSQTLRELPAVMADPTIYASRDGHMVGEGSCGISQYDAVPLVHGLLDTLADAPDGIVDLGCGDGTVLLSLCEGGIAGIGVDPDAASIAGARTTAERIGRGDVSFVQAAAEEFLAAPPSLPPGRICFLAAFSLQEVLEQRDRDAVVELIRSALAIDGAYLAVVEVDHRPSDPAIMRHELALAYYNPYYLLHEVTEQRLEAADFWRDVFHDAGADVVAWATVDSRVDSTRLEFGSLLTRRPA